MTITPKPAQPAGNDAAANALARERKEQGQEGKQDQDNPVKQHNPDDQGMNPSQKGPAQPTDPSR